MPIRISALSLGDGTQIVTVSPGEMAQEFRFSFAASYVEMKNGYVLVWPDHFAEPEKIIDPAWAQDTAGNKVKTCFEVDGDALIQHVDKSVNGAPVVALGSGYCAGKVRAAGLPGWLLKGACVGVGSVATHAANTGRCVAIRAVGPRYDAPNLAFPYVIRC